MLLFVMVLPSLPEVVPVEKNRMPEVAVVLGPETVIWAVSVCTKMPAVNARANSKVNVAFITVLLKVRQNK